MIIRRFIRRTPVVGAPPSNLAGWKRRFSPFLLAAPFFFAYSLPASGNILFSDLGPAGSIYDDTSFWNICGNLGCGMMQIANRFVVEGTGSQSVTRIDIATGSILPPNTFDVAIWTDLGGVPGTEVPNAEWHGLSAAELGPCCGNLVTIGSIAGVRLDGGQQYFLVVKPSYDFDTTWNIWYYNNTGVEGLALASMDGGSSWFNATSSPSNALGAFDILGTPEPGTTLVCGALLIALLCRSRLWKRHSRERHAEADARL